MSFRKDSFRYRNLIYGPSVVGNMALRVVARSIVSDRATGESAGSIRHWRSRIIHRDIWKKGSKRPRGLSLILVGLAVIPPELAFAHGFKLMLNALQNFGHIVADVLQMALNTLEFVFQIVSVVVDRWHTLRWSYNCLYILYGSDNTQRQRAPIQCLYMRPDRGGGGRRM